MSTGSAVWSWTVVGALMACAPAGSRNEESLTAGVQERDATLVIVHDIAHGNWCSGVLMGTGHVLTARHCVQQPGAAEPVDAGDVRVAIGSTARRPEAWLDVGSVAVEAGSYSDLASLSGRDLALLRLIDESGHEGHVLAPPDAAPAWAAGFGRTPGGAFGELTVAGVEVVRADVGEIVTRSVTCAGDSGGPLLWTRQRGWWAWLRGQPRPLRFRSVRVHAHRAASALD